MSDAGKARERRGQLVGSVISSKETESGRYEVGQKADLTSNGRRGFTSG